MINGTGFKFNGEYKIVVEDPNMTDAERVWDRLKHGIKETTLEDEMARIMAEEIRKAIDADVLEALKSGKLK